MMDRDGDGDAERALASRQDIATSMVAYEATKARVKRKLRKPPVRTSIRKENKYFAANRSRPMNCKDLCRAGIWCEKLLYSRKICLAQKKKLTVP
jgi:hypothetical protein